MNAILPLARRIAARILGLENPTGRAIKSLGAKGRIPINIWGDVRLKGLPPVVRRVLCGIDAHDCMFAWVYLNEFLTLAEMKGGTNFQDPTKELIKGNGLLSSNFEILRKRTQDPQSQVTQDLITIFFPLALAIKLSKGNEIEFCELGSTFFSSIEKLEIARLVSNLSGSFNEILFTGIEYSQFLRRAGEFCHQDYKIRYFTSWDQWEPERKYTFCLSRFVASYAMKSTDVILKWLQKFKVFCITEIFNSESSEFECWENGLPVRFFNLSAFIDTMVKNGWVMYLTDAFPDYTCEENHKCLVGRIFGIKQDYASNIGFLDHLTKYPDFATAFSSSLIQAGTGAAILERTIGQKSKSEWKKIMSYKNIYPIWGRVPDVNWHEFKRKPYPGSLNLDLTFDDNQIRASVWDYLANFR